MNELIKENHIYEYMYISQLLKEFCNYYLPINEFTHYNRLKLIYYSLVKYGLKNTIRYDGWLIVTWKKYIYMNINGEDNDYFHYGIIKFWCYYLNSLNVNKLVNENELDNDFNNFYVKWNLNDNKLWMNYTGPLSRVPNDWIKGYDLMN